MSQCPLEYSTTIAATLLPKYSSLISLSSRFSELEAQTSRPNQAAPRLSFLCPPAWPSLHQSRVSLNSSLIREPAKAVCDSPLSEKPRGVHIAFTGPDLLHHYILCRLTLTRQRRRLPLPAVQRCQLRGLMARTVGPRRVLSREDIVQSLLLAEPSNVLREPRDSMLTAFP